MGPRKEPRYTTSFLSNVPRNEPPLQVRQRGPYGQKYSSTGHLHISKRPDKNSCNKKVLRKKSPSVYPKSGAAMEIDAHFRALLNGYLDTGFSWFPCVYKQMLRWFPRFQVATTCFSCSPPDLNLLVTNFMFCIHAK